MGGHDLVILWDNTFKEVKHTLDSTEFLKEVKGHKEHFIEYDLSWDKGNQINDNKADVFKSSYRLQALYTCLPKLLRKRMMDVDSRSFCIVHNFNSFILNIL